MDMVKKWLHDFTDVAVGLIALGVAVNVLFGSDAPFLPNVIGSINSILMELGSQQLVGLFTLMIGLYLLRHTKA
jgi:NhaP-type Na+/H+ or K+/H+ antiporter